MIEDNYVTSFGLGCLAAYMGINQIYLEGGTIMLLRKTICLVLFTGLVIATTGYADVIPFFRGNRGPFVAGIDLSINKIPLDMTLVFLDSQKKERIIANKEGTSEISIFEPGTFYIASTKQLSTPFSKQHDMSKLIPLRTIEKDDIPTTFNGQVPPLCLCCSVERTKDSLALRCSEKKFTYNPRKCESCSEAK
jgi:hypothetical protein